MGRLHVLNFHGVGDPGGTRQLEPGEDRVWVDEPSFLGILDRVKNEPGVQITFDDGNKSDIDRALPALLERGLTATFFIIVDRIDQPDCLTCADLDEMLRSGMQIGSHGYSHVSWRGMTADTAQREIFDAKTELEQVIGQSVATAACPFGTYDRRSLGELRKAGFEAVYTSDGGPTAAGLWLQARNSLHMGDNAEFVDRLLAEPAVGVQPMVRWGKKLIKRWR